MAASPTLTVSAQPGLNLPLSMLLAGIAGLAVWEPFARLVAPVWLGHPLEPTALIELSLGISGAAAQALHIATGLVFYPLGYMLVVQPLAARLSPALPWPLLGAAYGVGLWVFALFVMASMVGGLPPFLGFEPVSWASLLGHVGLGLGIAAMVARLRRRAG